MQIELGSMCPKISEQLIGLKKPIPADRLEILDKLADSLNWVWLHGLISDSERNRAGKKLIAKIQKEINKL